MSGDRLSIVGYFLETQDVDVEEWVECVPAVAWWPTKVPVVLSHPPLRVDFVDPHELERRRRAEAAQAITAALDSASGERPFERAARLEHADRILGGNPVAVAALVALNKKLGGKDDSLGSPRLLLARIRQCAPSGLAGVAHELNRLGFEYLRTPAVRATLLEAADEAFASKELLNPDDWDVIAHRTFWTWWLRWRATVANVSVPGLSQMLGITARELQDVLHGKRGPEVIRDRLPSTEQVKRDLHEAYNSPADPSTAASLAAIAQPRLELMAEQLAELERRVNDLQRLMDWEKLRQELLSVALWEQDQVSEPVWSRARAAAERVRALLGMDSDDPVGLDKLVSAFAARIVGAALPSAHFLGTWAVGYGAPVVALTPTLLTGDLGVTRFAIAHQLGHVLESTRSAGSASCWEMVDRDPVTRDPREKFANAFSVYLLAPRSAVRRHVGYPNGLTDEWLSAAARDAAISFGLSSRTALRHVLNCLGESESAASRVDAMIQDPHWRTYRGEVRDQVENQWAGDRVVLDSEVGSGPPDEAAAVFQRPHSAVFDRLVVSAVSQGVMDAAAADRLSGISR